MSSPYLSSSQTAKIASAVIQVGIPLLAAALLFFQTYLPIGAMPLNVNLADPLAAAALIVVLASLSLKWRHEHVAVVFATCTAVMTIGLLIGVWHVGFTKWAFINKYVGWFLLLGFGSAGALAGRYTPERAIQIFIYTFCAVGVFAIGRQGLINLGVIDYSPMTGFAQNQNALSFQALMVLCAILSRQVRHETWLAAIPLACCILSGSRSSIGVAALLFVVAITFVPRTLPRIVIVVTGAIVIFGAVYSLSFAPGLIASLFTSHGGAPGASPLPLHSVGVPFAGDFTASNSEHITTIIAGLKMFWNHPIFGNGLGSFAAEWKGASTAGVIHSTSVWLLAEFGLVGAIIFGLPLILLFWREAKLFRANDESGRLIILMITAFSAMSLLHELMYQRALWFLLGYALVAKIYASSQVIRASH